MRRSTPFQSVSLAALMLMLTIPMWAQQRPSREVYPVPAERIAASVLRDAFGALTVQLADEAPMDSMRTYVKKNDRFLPSASIAFSMTTPMSRRWVSAKGSVSATMLLRYPIVGGDGLFLRIVTDPAADERVWVHRKELEETFAADVLFFDDPDALRAEHVRVNIACFTKSGRRRVYEAPRRIADSRVISARNRQYDPPVDRQYRVLDLQGEFIQIAEPIERFAGTAPPPPIGWVRIRQNSGELLVWVESPNTP